MQPEDQATIRNNQGYLPIIVQTEPELKAGDKVQVIFDGAPLGEPQATTVFALRDITRGSHTLAVKVMNAEGKELNTSESITVFIQRPRVGMVPETHPARTP